MCPQTEGLSTVPSLEAACSRVGEGGEIRIKERPAVWRIFSRRY